MPDRRLHQPKLRLSQDLPDARRERVLPAPIRMHRASNQVRRKLQEAHQEGEEGLKGRRMESRCAGAFTPLHFQYKIIHVIKHQQSLRVLIIIERKGKGEERKRKRREISAGHQKVSYRWSGASECGGASGAISTLQCSFRAERAIIITILASRNLFLCSELSLSIHLSK